MADKCRRTAPSRRAFLLAGDLLDKIKDTRLSSGDSGARMPLGGRLKPADTLTVEQWIAAGAPAN